MRKKKSVLEVEAAARTEGADATDEAVALRCRKALYEEPLILPGSVHPLVQHGFVTLTGRVSHPYERRVATHTVKDVDGVLGVVDRISVQEP